MSMYGTRPILQIKIDDGDDKIHYVAAVGNYWTEVLDENPYLLQALKKNNLQSKFQSSIEDRFVGAGIRLVLIYSKGQALMVWKPEISPSGEKCFSCRLFVNKTATSSSKLIYDAYHLAFSRCRRPLVITLIPKLVNDFKAIISLKKPKWKQIGVTDEGFPILEFRPSF